MSGTNPSVERIEYEKRQNFDTHARETTAPRTPSAAAVADLATTLKKQPQHVWRLTFLAAWFARTHKQTWPATLNMLDASNASAASLYTGDRLAWGSVEAAKQWGPFVNRVLAPIATRPMTEADLLSALRGEWPDTDEARQVNLAAALCCLADRRLIEAVKDTDGEVRYCLLRS